MLNDLYIGGKTVCAVCITAAVAFGSYYVYNKYYKAEEPAVEEKPAEEAVEEEKIEEEKPAEEVEEKPAEETTATPSA